MNPSGAHNNHYKEVLQVFRRYECWSQLIFYCKPYAKATNEKKNAVFGNQGQAQAQQFQTGYGETIAKPTFIIKEKEREVFLNGEVQNLKKNVGFGEQGRCLKKTVLCLKCLSVDPCLSQEALRITYADRKATEKWFNIKNEWEGVKATFILFPKNEPQNFNPLCFYRKIYISVLSNNTLSLSFKHE